MENNENLVTEVTENVETTTEEIQSTAKTYTQEEVDAIVGKSKARAKAQAKKENDRKYGKLIEVLQAGTGKESVEEMTDTFAKFYEGKGIKIRREPNYSDADIETLAIADANNVINSGFEDVVDEVDRLADIGVENMTAREKVYFKTLAEHRQKTERHNELSKIGVTDEEYNSNEFQEFAKMFNSTTPIAKIYETYRKTQPKKDIKPMGSLSNKSSDDGTIKDYYTADEARRFTKEDFDKNPALFKAVCDSMTKW